jgi:recombination protein RecT
MSDTKRRPLTTPNLPRENYVPIKAARNLEELFLSSEFRERIMASVPTHITPDRMLSVCLRAHSGNPLLVKATPTSFAGACLTASNIGLEPNSALNEAHLIPFRRTIKERGKPDREVVEIQVIFGYSGLLKLAYNTKQILNTSANVVYTGSDVFDWQEGTDSFLKFKRGGRRERSADDRPEYAYFHANTVGGGQAIEVWPYGEVLRIRNMSQGYRRALRALEEAQKEGKRPPLTWTAAPWVAHEEPMARKTMIRHGTKYLPKSAELANAVRIDEAHDRRDIDYGKVIDMAGTDANPDYASAAAHLGERSDDPEPEYMPTGSPGAAPDAAFTDRRPDSTADAGRRPEGSEAELEEFRRWKAAQPAPIVQEKPEPLTDPSFEAFLIDEVGDYDPEPFVDPVQWARGFINLWQHARDTATLLENNEQALEEARKFPIADQLLAVMEERRDLPKLLSVILKESREGKPDWRGYTAEFRSVLFGLRGDLATWLDFQREVMQRAPLPTRLLLLKHIRERGDQLKAGLPEWVIDLTGAPGKPPTPAPPRPQPKLVTDDKDARWVDDIIHTLSEHTTARAVAELGASPDVQREMKRLRRENPAQFERADNAFAAKLEELGPPDEPEPPDAA